MERSDWLFIGYFRCPQEFVAIGVQGDLSEHAGFFKNLMIQEYNPGPPAARTQPGEGRKWLAANFDFISSAGRLWNGTLGFADWLGSFRGVEELQWFAADDLRPFLSMAMHSLRWLFRRNESCLRTPALTNLPPWRSHVRNSLGSGIAFATQQQTNGPSGEESLRP
ncbi:MAG: hypothetical protein WB819_01155 [Terriglobia bacterium]|jgi:hypothetical protein